MRSSILVQFASRLKALRADAGLTQDSLSDRTGLHVTYIAGLEGGRRNPSLMTLARLAYGLGISLADLLTGVAADGISVVD